MTDHPHVQRKSKRQNAGKKIPFKWKRIGFVLKHRHPESIRLGLQLMKSVLREDFDLVLCDESPEAFKEITSTLKSREKKRIRKVPKPQMVNECDLIVVLGGDGTFVSIARWMKNRSIPILGVNLGQLGFLTEVKRSEAQDILSQMIKGKSVQVSERALLEVSLEREGKVIFQGPVVNDAVISKGAIARIIGLEIYVNESWVHDVRADGVIVGTPTGSTAYSLAAGGPIIAPQVPALVLSMICPHSLTQRPLVIGDDSEIQIRLKQRPGHVLLTLDGQDAVDMKEGDVVRIRKFQKHRLKMVMAGSRDYYGLLREKLRFGERA